MSKSKSKIKIRVRHVGHGDDAGLNSKAVRRRPGLKTIGRGVDRAYFPLNGSMSWRTSSVGIIGVACICLLLAGRKPAAKVEAPVQPTAQAQASQASPVVLANADLFTATNVPAFALEISAANVQALRDEPRAWVRATLQTRDAVYHDVSVHIKGSQGSLQSIDERPSLTVSFKGPANDGVFHGLRKIHFNNSAEDPSAMTQILCGELCRQSGLPAARSCHATLTLNRRKLGLYVLTEGLTRQFLAQHFARTDGNLYDGGFRKDIDERMERIGGKGPDTQRDRSSLAAAAREPDPQRRWERLQKLLDTERFISLLAVTTLTWNWDGYPMARNNYRVYHDPETDKMVFIPHGLDQMFWEPQGPIYPRMRGLVAAAVMGTPQGRAAYRARLQELNRDVFTIASIHSRIDELTARIVPYRSDAQQQAARLKKLIAGRSKFVSRQLGSVEQE